MLENHNQTTTTLSRLCCEAHSLQQHSTVIYVHLTIKNRFVHMLKVLTECSFLNIQWYKFIKLRF